MDIGRHLLTNLKPKPMKRLPFLLVLGIVLTFSHPRQTQAQWYKSYGVTSIDELSKDQCETALGKVNKRESEAIGLIAGGGLLLLFGSLVSVKPGVENVVAGIGKGLAIDAGGVIAACGVLSLVNCAIREARITKVLARFNVKVSLLPQIIQENDNYSLGLSLAIRF
jgi:hypothetical protein